MPPHVLSLWRKALRTTGENEGKALDGAIQRNSRFYVRWLLNKSCKWRRIFGSNCSRSSTPKSKLSLHPSALAPSLFHAYDLSPFLPLRCVVPSGGQAPTPYGVAPLVTYLLTFKDHYRETENCLASLMRYAHEASSAEFLLVDDGSTARGMLLLEYKPSIGFLLALYSCPLLLRSFL